MNEELKKSLVELIEESLAEIEDLKKSARFSAAEVSIGDSKSGMKDHEKNGCIEKEDRCDMDYKDKKKKDMDDKDMDDKDMDDKDMDDKDKKKKYMKKKDMDYKDMDDKDKKKKDMDKADGQNRQADPYEYGVAKEDSGMPEGTAAEGYKRMDKDKGQNLGSDPRDGKLKKSTQSNLEEELKKSRAETEELLKSYVDKKISSLEELVKGVVEMLNELADSPEPSKGSTYKDVTPLKKSEESEEPLNKSEVLGKLFELKKSGQEVATADIASIELGGPAEVSAIIHKYNLK